MSRRINQIAAPKPQLKQLQGGVRALPAPLLLLLLSAILLFVILLGISFGSTPIPLGTIIEVLLNGTQLFHFAQPWYPTGVIVWQVRMPGVFGAALVGAALGVAGVLFQGMLRNPLADPFLIGTSSGAALGAAIAFVLPLDTVFGSFFPLTPLLAFVGAMFTVLLVYTIARVGSYTPVVTLLLAGVVINAVLVAFQTLILELSPHAAFGIQALFNWLSGGIAVYSWSPVLIVGAIIIAGILCSLLLANVLDAFGLGEESAANLGLHVERSKLIIIIVGSLLTAAAVSISGLIGFVGLVTPHAMRMLLGPRHRLLLPASALGGAIFLTLADLLARVIIAPSVLPVGIFTALVGAPFFLLLLRNNKREYRW
ncbi:MAG TPA: iron ABC transporter permease [Ktedonobacteraceae bacterium]|nr:iron ABC transporter permease [Ktedonobacteraceae bacterium]